MNNKLYKITKYLTYGINFATLVGLIIAGFTLNTFIVIPIYIIFAVVLHTIYSIVRKQIIIQNLYKYNSFTEDFENILNVYLTFDDKSFRLAQKRLIKTHKLNDKKELNILFKKHFKKFYNEQIDIKLNASGNFSAEEINKATLWINKFANKNQLKKLQRRQTIGVVANIVYLILAILWIFQILGN